MSLHLLILDVLQKLENVKKLLTFEMQYIQTLKAVFIDSEIA